MRPLPEFRMLASSMVPVSARIDGIVDSASFPVSFSDAPLFPEPETQEFPDPFPLTQRQEGPDSLPLECPDSLPLTQACPDSPPLPLTQEDPQVSGNHDDFVDTHVGGTGVDDGEHIDSDDGDDVAPSVPAGCPIADQASFASALGDAASAGNLVIGFPLFPLFAAGDGSSKTHLSANVFLPGWNCKVSIAVEHINFHRATAVEHEVSSEQQGGDTDVETVVTNATDETLVARSRSRPPRGCAQIRWA